MPTYTTKRPVANSDIQILAFVKEASIWYADLPEFLEAGLGTRTNLMMVDGACSGRLRCLLQGCPVKWPATRPSALALPGN